MNHWKINFIILAVAIALLTTTSVTIGMEILRDLKVKENQITKLIDEVGEIKKNREPIEIQTIPVTQPKEEIAQAKKTNQEVYLIVGHHSRLTDTIIVAITDHTGKKITLLSIPRDLATNGRKINEYYEFFGIKKLAEEVTKIIDLKIDKYVLVDMKSFKRFINDIGGVDVKVEKDLIDYSYPTEKKGYQTFSIKKGQHHMNGDTALKYARSRKSTSDFDRSIRQQELLKSIRANLNANTNIIKLLETTYLNVQDNVETNISYLDALLTWSKVSSYDMRTSHVMTTSDLLYSTYNSAGQYILLPKVKDYSEIQKKVIQWLAE